MELFTSKLFLQALPTYKLTAKVLNHPAYGDFSILETSEGLKIIKKIITAEQFAWIDDGLFEQIQKFESPYILQFKGVIEQQNEKGVEYAVFYEYFDFTLKQEIEEKALKHTRYTSKEVLHLLQNISKGLSHMQTNQLVHGEVKSSNIVKVGNDYKLICPALFGKLLPHINQPTPSIKNSKKIISPEILNAIHRDIIDPVHEDYKDDVYGLGLVALDMMTLRVEAPIPVIKKLERANFYYSNTLLRLIKKMLEDVLTLRLDPVACNLYIEKIYSNICQESSRPFHHQRQFTPIGLETREDEEIENSYFSEPQEKCISQDSSPIGICLTRRHESFTPEPRTMSFMPAGDMGRSPSRMINDIDLHGKETFKIKDILSGVHREQELPESHVMQRSQIELHKFATPEPHWMKKYDLENSPKGEGSQHCRKNSVAYSASSTNSTFYSRPSKRDVMNDTKLNILDMSRLSPGTENSHVRRYMFEFGNLEGEIKLTEEALEKVESMLPEKTLQTENDDLSRPLQDLTKKFTIPLNKINSEEEGKLSKNSSNKEKAEATPRFKENELQTQTASGKKTHREGQKQNQILGHIKISESQKTQFIPGVFMSDKSRENIKETKPKEILRENIENKGYSIPRNLEDCEGKKIIKINKKVSNSIVPRTVEIRIKCDDVIEPVIKCSESSLPNDEKEKLTSNINLRKSHEAFEIRNNIENVPTFVQQPVKLGPVENESDKQSSVMKESVSTASQPSSRTGGSCYSSWIHNASEAKEVTIKTQTLSNSLPPCASEFSARPVPHFNASYMAFSQFSGYGNQCQKPRKVTEKLGDGSIYEGEMVGYIKHGKGKMTYPDGKYYEGNWDDGKMAGHGILYTKEGNVIYDGQWQDGKSHGQGTVFNLSPSEGHILWEDQPRVPIKELGAWTKYQGNFVEDNWEGVGELFLSNGDKYCGEFKCNKVEGKGKYLAKDGRVWEGEWQSNYLTKFVNN